MDSIEANKAAARRFLERLSKGDLDTLEALVGPQYVRHDPSTPEEARGVVGARDMVEAFRNASGIESQSSTSSPTAPVTCCTVRGRHDADFMGVAPTGRNVTGSSISISRCRDGKIVEEADALGALQQVGGLPESTP